MWKCSKCNSEVDDEFEICWNCSAEKGSSSSFNPEVEKVASEIKAEIARHEETRRYPALRTFSFMFKILGYIVFILTIFALILQVEKNSSNALALLLTIAVGLLAGLTFLATSESIIVLVDIEANTRKATDNKDRN